jgi:hypothetical protein
MKPAVQFLLGIFLVLRSAVAADASEGPAAAAPGARPSAVPEQVRKELLDARATAWGAFFQKDQKVLDEILAPELIAIQQNSDHWEDRTRLLNKLCRSGWATAMAGSPRAVSRGRANKMCLWQGSPLRSLRAI